MHEVIVHGAAQLAPALTQLQQIAQAPATGNTFQDTIQKVIDLIDGAKVGIITLVVIVAGLTAAFTRGHKGEIVGGAVFAVMLVVGAKSIATALGA